MNTSFEREYAKYSNDVDAEFAFPIELSDYKEFAYNFYLLALEDVRKEVEKRRVEVNSYKSTSENDAYYDGLYDEDGYILRLIDNLTK